MEQLARRIAQSWGVPSVRLRRLHGGSVGEVYAATTADGRQIVAKVDRSARPTLDVEGFMLDYLAEQSALPVPRVLFCTPDLLLMTALPGRSSFSAAAERDAADRLVALHALSAPTYGFPRDTLIGGLPQPNRPERSWITFFREQRLLHRGRAALDAGRLPPRLFARLTRCAERLEEWLEEPERPSLIHGDVWTTNVLAEGDRITGFLDPAVYYADPEIELAFVTLFGTFGRPFFEHYREQRPIKPGFFEQRRTLYNLYPLLVHVQLFGGGYVGQVEESLRALGC